MTDVISAALVHPVPSAVVPILHTNLGKPYLAIGDRDGPRTDGQSPGKTFERSVSIAMVQELLVKMRCVGVLAWWSELTLERRAWLQQLANHGVAIAVLASGHGEGFAQPLPDDWYVIGLVGPDSADLAGHSVAEWVWRLEAMPESLPASLLSLPAQRPNTALTIQSAVPGAGAEADEWVLAARSFAHDAGLAYVYDAKHQHTVCPNCGESWVARRGPKVRRLVGEQCVCGQQLPNWLA